MTLSKLSVVSMFVLLVIGTSAPGSYAQVEIHPRFYVAQEYTDNVFLDNNNEQDDWITTIEPGFNLVYGARSVDLTLDYSLQYIKYQHNTEEDINEFKDMQRANMNAVFFRGRPFNVTLSEVIARETLDDRLNSFDYNEAVNRTTVYRTSVLPTYRLRLAPTFSVIFDYFYNRVDYINPLGNDSEEHTGRVSLVKQLSSNTEVFTRYSYTAHKSNDDADFDQQDYTVGVTQQFGPRLSGSAEAGLSQIEYDDGFDADNTHWLLNLSYRFSEALSLTANFDQSYATTATDGLAESKEASLAAAYVKNSLTANAEIFWRQLDYVQFDRKDRSYGTRFDIRIPLTRAFSTSFDTEYEKVKFEDLIIEEADRISFGVSLGYEYRRVLASLGYRYRTNDSDINSNDYQNNIITLSASLRF